jgi:hypothetical protein
VVLSYGKLCKAIDEVEETAMKMQWI